MRRTYLTLLVFSLVTVELFVCNTFGKVAEQIDENNAPKMTQGQPGLSKERVDKIIDRLKQTDPEKAEELEKLRTEDPEKFKTELRNTMQAQLTEQITRHQRQKVQKDKDTDVSIRKSVLLEGEASKQDADYPGWLRGNYPEEAQRLAELKEKSPDTYQEQLRMSRSRYGRIFEASKTKPELAEVLKEDLKLKEQQDALVEKINSAIDEKQKADLVKELEDVISRRYDLSLKEKQIRHKELLERLEKLQEQIKEDETEIEKHRDNSFKTEHIKTTVDKLIK